MLSASRAFGSRFHRIPRRSKLQIALGATWILDGLLQAQPSQFSSQVAAGIREDVMGQPGWIHAMLFSFAGLIAAHVALFNVTLSLVEVGLGLAVIRQTTRRRALLVSIPLALGIWVLGEAFGNLATGFSMLPFGSPGAALLYALLALVLLDRRGSGACAAEASAAGQRVLSDRGAGSIWGLTWLLAAVVQAAPSFPFSFKLSASWQMQSEGEPGMLRNLDIELARFAGNHGGPLTLALVAFELGVGLAGVLAPARRRPLLIAAIVGCAVFWVCGENLGGLATGTASDPGAMPLYVLFALALYPSSVRAASRVPASLAIGTPMTAGVRSTAAAIVAGGWSQRPIGIGPGVQGAQPVLPGLVSAPPKGH